MLTRSIQNTQNQLYTFTYRQKTIEDQIQSNSFLKNIWELYFLTQNKISIEVKKDHMNKILAIFKSQKNQQELLTLKNQNQKLKTTTQNMKFRQQCLIKQIKNKNQSLQESQKLNEDLKIQLFQTKVNKSKCQQKLIQLTKKIYQLERGTILNHSVDYSQIEDPNDTLDQYSAISTDLLEQRDSSRISRFCKRESFNLQNIRCLQDSRHLKDHDAQEDNLKLNLNVSTKINHPLKQSLQIGTTDRPIQYHPNDRYIEDMKKMKIQTERMMRIENERYQQRDKGRKTMQGMSHPFQDASKKVEGQTKRFKRIRG